MVLFTSDHGDMCGAHGLRSKGPFAYDEIVRVPLCVRVPGVTRPGTVTEALSTHVDLASTICTLAGLDPAAGRPGGAPTLQGGDLTAVLADPAASVRDHVLFAQDSAHTENVNGARCALRESFDGTTKYARYHAAGGGIPATGLWGRERGSKRFGPRCDVDDQDHEWYDTTEEPGEMVNLANDPGRRSELRRLLGRLAAYERDELDRPTPTF